MQRHSMMKSRLKQPGKNLIMVKTDKYTSRITVLTIIFGMHISSVLQQILHNFLSAKPYLMNRKTAVLNNTSSKTPSAIININFLSSRVKTKGKQIYFNGVLWSKVVLNVQLYGLWTKSHEVFTQMKSPNLPALLHH